MDVSVLLDVASFQAQGHEVIGGRLVSRNFVQLLAVGEVLLQGGADLRQDVIPTEQLGLFDTELVLVTANLEDTLEPPNGLDERMLVALALRFVEAGHQRIRLGLREHLLRVNDDDVLVRAVFHLELKALRLLDLLGRGRGGVSVAVRYCRAI